MCGKFFFSVRNRPISRSGFSPSSPLPEKFQNHAIAVDNRSVALFRLYWPWLQDTCGISAENVKYARILCVDFPFNAAKHSFPFKGLDETMQEFRVGESISQMQVDTTLGAVHRETGRGALLRWFAGAYQGQQILLSRPGRVFDMYQQHECFEPSAGPEGLDR